MSECPTGKHRYGSEMAADVAGARQVRIEREAGRYYYTNSYRCKACGGWHFGRPGNYYKMDIPRLLKGVLQ